MNIVNKKKEKYSKVSRFLKFIAKSGIVREEKLLRFNSSNRLSAIFYEANVFVPFLAPPG